MALQCNRVEEEVEEEEEEEEKEECCTKRQGGGQKLEKSRVEKKKSVPCSCWMMETHFGDDQG